MILKQGRQIARLQAGGASGIFIPNRIAIHLYSICDDCVEVEMQLQANKLTYKAQAPNLSASGSVATDDVDCCTSSCNGSEASPTKHMHLISPIPRS
jgi:hypothetical protein